MAVRIDLPQWAANANAERLQLVSGNDMSTKVHVFCDDTKIAAALAEKGITGFDGMEKIAVQAQGVRREGNYNNNYPYARYEPKDNGWGEHTMEAGMCARNKETASLAGLEAFLLLNTDQGLVEARIPDTWTGEMILHPPV